MRILLAWICLQTPLEAAPAASSGPTVLVVVGAPGLKEYGAAFDEWAGRWKAIGAEVLTGSDADSEDENAPGVSGQKARVRDRLASLAEAGPGPLWIVWIGHGTFAADVARFNLVGPDVTAREIAEWVAPIERPLVIAACFASSGPFVNRLSAPGRVIVTATRSGDEYNFSRFGDAFSAAITDLAADLDKDEQVSLLEAFLFASARTQEFYRSQARLATEHALLDDNGDGLGTPASFYRGVRAVRTPKDGGLPDGPRAHQVHLLPSERERALPQATRERRDALELQIAALRSKKDELSETEYYSRLEAVLLELAELLVE